ncbi:hypothetical protein D1872_218670 [compost metagenome]
MAAHKFIETEYTPVIRPIFFGNSCLIMLGNSTFPIAIAIPSKAVPRNSVPTAGTERKRIPAVKTSKLTSNVASIPILRAILGANGERSAKANNGKVVSMPANAFDMPVSSRMTPINGPTDVSGARKLDATSIIPKISSHSPARE